MKFMLWLAACAFFCTDAALHPGHRWIAAGLAAAALALALNDVDPPA